MFWQTVATVGLMLTAPLFADPEATCLGPLQAMAPSETLPPAIAETKRAQEYANAIDAYGDILKEGETLSEAQTQDGHYLYLIARANGKQYVLWSLRSPGKIEGSPEKNLVTHSALLEQLIRKLAIDPNDITVRAAGQTQILYGEVAILDNKSGSRRGGPKHLAFAETVLSAAGLNILPKESLPTTQRNDHSKTAEDEEAIHGDADDVAKIVVKVQGDPRLSALTKEILRRHRLIYEEFPELRHPEIAGHLDMDRVLARAEVDPEYKLSNIDANVVDLSMFRLALRYLQKDGPEFAANAMRDFTDDRILQSLDWGIAQHRARRALAK